MKHRHILLLLTLIAATAATAQHVVGSWQQFPVYGRTVSQAVETPTTLYFTSEGSLFARATDADESRSLDNTNDLNDVDVSLIRYNPQGRYLMVAYGNANLDLVRDNGRTLAMPDIKDAVTYDPKTVYDINFGADGRIYVATSIGMVVFDDRRGHVIQSGRYNKKVYTAFELADMVMVGCEYDFYWARLGDRLGSLQTMTRAFGIGNITRQARVLDREANRFVLNTDGGLHIFCMRPTPTVSSPYTERVQYAEYKGCSDLIETADGRIYFEHSGSLYHITPQGEIVKLLTLPEPLQGQIYAMAADPTISPVWAVDTEGVAQYRLTADGAVTVLSEKARPAYATTVSRVGTLFPTADGMGAYVSNYPCSNYRPAATAKANDPQTTDLFSQGSLTDVAPRLATSQYKNTPSWQKTFKWNGLFAPTFILENPADPSMLYMGTAYEGVFALREGEQLAQFYTDNSPLVPANGCRAFGGAFDRAGNLWVGQEIYKYEDAPEFIVLPAAKTLTPEAVTAADWHQVNLSGYITSKDHLILPCKKSDIVFLYVGSSYSPLAVYDTRGTWTDFTDDRLTLIQTFTDQDGKRINPYMITSMAEDHDGRVWLGLNDGGILEIANPADALNPNFTVNHIKVPRNDGSNLADYLAGTTSVYAISVDPSNRKWIATGSAGVYLVSPRGDKILAHFDTSNSPLPTDRISSVLAIEGTNSVLVGTTGGLFEYTADSAPARPDYSEVYAYPNPVTPDYTGWITIRGLMDNSLVKICDSAMQTVAQIQSEGGMALWDGLNASGARVPSGVYYVAASTSATAGTSTADIVAKILVVR